MAVTEFLTTLAQLGVAVAGFSGIVLVLGKPASADSFLDRIGFFALPLGSAGIVLWSLIPLLLITAEVPDRTTWIVSSVGWSIMQTGILVWRTYQVRRHREARAGVGAYVASMFLGGVVALALQIVNVAWLATAWPHLVALVWWLAFTFVIFLRLMSAQVRGD